MQWRCSGNSPKQISIGGPVRSRPGRWYCLPLLSLCPLASVTSRGASSPRLLRRCASRSRPHSQRHRRCSKRAGNYREARAISCLSIQRRSSRGADCRRARGRRRRCLQGDFSILPSRCEDGAYSTDAGASGGLNVSSPKEGMAATKGRFRRCPVGRWSQEMQEKAQVARRG